MSILPQLRCILHQSIEGKSNKGPYRQLDLQRGDGGVRPTLTPRAVKFELFMAQSCCVVSCIRRMSLNYVTPGNLSRFYHKDTRRSYFFCLWLESVLKYECGFEVLFLLQTVRWPRRIPIDYFFFVYLAEIFFEGQKKRKSI